MKAVIYARYSSDNQTEASIEGQLRECLEYAENAGIDVIANYIDRALSAKTDNRPEFQRMIKDSNKHVFDYIIVWKLDRFARNRYDSAYYKNILRKNGVKVISAKETISEGSEGILLESMLEGMAEYYSAELGEKVVRGMTENALKGINNGGQITFGYKMSDDRKFEIDEITAPIVKEIYTMYADGYTIKQIVDYLDSKNIRSSRGGKHNSNSVQRILSNRRYIGEYKFRDTVVPHCIPQIISNELFDRVQERLSKNKKAPARFKADVNYILTLKLFCGKCGAHMVGESGMGTSKVYYYYKCANTKKVHICDKKPVRKEWIEDLVVRKTLNMLEDETLIDYLTDRIFKLQGEENPRIPLLKTQLAETEKKLSNVMNAIEQGIITPTTKERMTQLESQKKELEISILQEKIKKPFLTKEQIRFGIEKFKKLDITTTEGKQRLIDSFVNSIYLYDDKVTITFNYKDGTQTVYLSEIEAAKNSDIKCLGAPKIDIFNKKCLFFCLF
jgi:DNA invertase Pin-like site-specific DNA recombinase